MLPGPPGSGDSVPAAEASSARHAMALAQLATDGLATDGGLDGDTERQHLDFLAALERGAVRLLNSSEPTLARVKATYKYVFVDEAQDLNPTQHRLIDRN